MIKISNNIYINTTHIKETFIRSSGQGGQHVNKVSTTVQLRFNVLKSLNISNNFLQRLKNIAGSRLNENGDLIIVSSRHKSQALNRKDALEKLVTDLVDASKLGQNDVGLGGKPTMCNVPQNGLVTHGGQFRFRILNSWV